MRTEILPGNRQGAERAGEILRAGGLVAIPTETVYGLAANALDGSAVKKIYAAKGRPGDNPLIAHIADLPQLDPLVREAPPAARRLAEAFWPGPLTIILKRSGATAPEMSCGLDTVSVRLPAHPLARAVIRAAGVPLAAPSANLSGRPSPTGFRHAYEDLNGRVDAVMDGGDCQVGVESTVISLADSRPRLLRPGGVTLDQLRAVLGEVEVDPAVLDRLAPGQKAASPGMKYKHYAPWAEVTLVDGSPEEFAEYVNAKAGLAEREGRAAGGSPLFSLCFDETAPLLAGQAIPYGPRYAPEEQARRLFGLLHRLDELGARRVYAQLPRKAGMGLAVYNRLIRAAAFRVATPAAPAVVGLVGPSGAGKSTVANIMRDRGFDWIDCDKLTKTAEVYDYNCIRDLQAAFGEDVAPGLVLDRRRLAERAFGSPEGVRRLEEITFPRILSAIRRRLEARTRPVLLDAPTLFEAGLDSACRRIIAVSAPEEERLGRIIRRDGLTREEALRRMGAQKPASFYADRADWVVENGPGDRLEEQIEGIIMDLKGGAGG